MKFYKSTRSLSFAFIIALALASLALASLARAQNARTPAQKTKAAPAPSQKKINARPTPAPRAQPTPTPEPFDNSTVEQMAQKCVTLETEAGAIEIEMLPEAAPETVRHFLNLVATGSFDTTTFSRIVKDFVIQGGNLSTSQRWSNALVPRAMKKIPDEPSNVRHVRGIVSMARPSEPNSATTHFFILVADNATQLDGTFAAFGRVTRGMDVVDAINKMPANGETPEKPVRITRAVVTDCKKQ